MIKQIKDLFLKYVAINSQSDENSLSIPSSNAQKEFAKIILKDIKNIGLQNVEIDNNGIITANLPSNCNDIKKRIGFIAHYDTSPDLDGKCLNPIIVEKYSGGDIILNKNKQIILKIKEHHELANYIGQTIIATDGTTLLGADDKAGVVEIIQAMRYLIENQNIKHGEIKIAFTPDEEIGRGVDNFDVEKFNSDYAYTIDGGEIGEIEYENFNAAQAKIKIFGNNIHPGYAKNKMINALLCAYEFHSNMPKDLTPSNTEGLEGFYHLTQITGSVEYAEMNYLVREHDLSNFEQKKTFLLDIASQLNSKYQKNIFEVSIKDQYFNMKYKILANYQIVENVLECMKLCQIEPKIKPIRGGTDGARLSYNGLLCPNIFTGGHNFHSKYEFIPLESMVKATQLIISICENCK